MTDSQSLWKQFQKNKKMRFSVKALISAILFVWVVIKVDWTVAWEYVSEVSFPLLFLYVALLLVGMLVSSCKWRMLTRHKGFKKSCSWHFQTYLAGTFVNNFLPSTIGGDTYRALELGTDAEGKHSPAVSTIFFDRLTGLWALALLGCIFSFLQYVEMMKHPFWLLIVSLMGLFLIIDILLTFDKNGYFIRVGRYFSEPIGNLVYEMTGFRDRRVVKKVFVLSIFFNLIGVGLANYVLFHAFGLSIGIFEFLGVIFVINAIAAVPISVNNIGVKEWAYFIFFGYLGLSTDVAVTVAIVSRFVQMILSFFSIPGYIRGKKR